MRIYLIALLLCSQTEIAGAFPNQEIKITVYTKAGGLIDTTARQLAKSIEAELEVPQSQSVIIKNHPGGAGLKLSLIHI